MRPILLALSCFAIPGISQSLTIGAKGGLRLTGDVPAYGVSDSKRCLVGPAVEVRLPLRLAFEVDALYSRLGNTFRIPLIGNASDIRTIADSWGFPLLASYRLRCIGSVLYPGDVTFSSVDWHAHDRALVFGAGLGIRTGHMRIAPEVRQLKWKLTRNPSSDDVAFYLRPPRHNEVQLPLEIGWSKK